MGMTEFWNSIRNAASFYRYGGPPPNAAPIDADVIDKGLRSSTNWLTSRTLTGWNEADVEEYFTPTDRERLVHAVNTFQAVTKPLNPYRPNPTPEQIETARPALAEIIWLLEFDRYTDADAFTTGKRMVLALATNPPPAVPLAAKRPEAAPKAAKAPAPAPASAVRTHSVKSGDIPATIAKQYGVKLEALLAANPQLDPKRMKIGQTLTLPAP